MKNINGLIATRTMLDEVDVDTLKKDLDWLMSLTKQKGGDMYEEDKETVRNIFKHIEGSPVRPGKHYFEDYRMLHRKLYDAKARILLIIDKLSVYQDDRDKLFEIVTNMSKSKQ